MGVAGGLNDNAAIPGPVDTYTPNGYGLYNMGGNVSEWVADVYRPMTSLDGDDFNTFRGNVFKQKDALSTNKKTMALKRTAEITKNLMHLTTKTEILQVMLVISTEKQHLFQINLE